VTTTNTDTVANDPEKDACLASCPKFKLDLLLLFSRFTQ
jgi:hypothetical protein